MARKNKLGEACENFRKALNKIGYTTSNLCFEYPANPKSINDCRVFLHIVKKKKRGTKE